MSTYSLTLRGQSGERLSTEQMDNNLLYLQQLALSGTTSVVNGATGPQGPQGATGPSGTSVFDITYTELYSAVTNESLSPGSLYRLTDYRSVNFLNGFTIANNNPATGPNFNPQEVYVGEQEVLILQAKSTYEISEVGYSETFPGDIVQYEPFTNKIGLECSIYNGQDLAGLTGSVSGFDLQWDGTNAYFNMPSGYPALFGHYFYLYLTFDGDSYSQDGTFEPLTPIISVCQYPSVDNMSRIRIDNNGMKVVLLDLLEADYLLYDVDSLYVETIYAVDDAYGWIVRRDDTLKGNDFPFDFRARKYRRFEIDFSTINPGLSTYYWGQGYIYKGITSSGNYQDLSCFGGDNYSNKWTGLGGPDIGYYRGYSDNVIFSNYSYQNNIGNRFYNNTIGSFNNNNIIGRLDNNTISAASYNNFGVGSLSNNIIAAGFDNNNILGGFYGNNIVNNFESNTIVSSFDENTIGSAFSGNDTDGFTGNTIGDYFYNNSIKNTFVGNTISDGFIYNLISYPVLTINFATASHVYADYNCTIFKNSTGNLRLSYIDGSDTIVYTSINS